jgi:hypothetical protein
MMDRRKGSLRFTTGQKEGGEMHIIFLFSSNPRYMGYIFPVKTKTGISYSQ